MMLIFKCGIIFLSTSITKNSKFNPDLIQRCNFITPKQSHTRTIKSVGVKYT